MKVSELIGDKIVKDWLSGIRATENTRGSYLQAMQQYTEFTDKTPLQILEEAESEIRAGLLMRERNITTYLREFRESFEAQELAPLTVKNRMTGISSFYKHYNIQLPVIPKSTKRAKPELKRKKIPTKEDIQAILRIADPLERALILIGISSGLSAIDIANLRVGDFIDGYDQKTGITTIHIIRQKMNYEFYTFLSPEASQAVHDYLDYRAREGKSDEPHRRDQLEKQRVRGKDGYLFVSRSVPAAYLKTKNEKQKEKMRALNTEAILAIYRRLNEEVQTSSTKGEYNINRSHNMRRFFNTTLLNNGAQLHFVDFLVGYQLDSTHEAYYRADPANLKEEYQKYVPYLTISKYAVVSDSDEFRLIKDENEDLKRELHTQKMIDEQELNNLVAFEVEQRIGDYMKENEKFKQEFQDMVAFYKKQIDATPELTEEEKKNIPEW